ncbi:sialate O-acetylesterase [Chanos chanos]|uniref:Sialate O-acetylesterase n=1 Tax=Chanos chanos TaxID=29144 RepID=A0A6J2UNP7_CHACN|nr:sialate O-acetylesterase [Chanos chanos]
MHPAVGSALLLSLLSSLVFADQFRFASYYGDHMVLQKAPERAVLWGYGTTGAEVIVCIEGLPENSTYSTNVINGIWTVTLPPVEAGGPYNVIAVQNKTSKIILTDVLFGDIWLCGGQSNMAFTISQVINASEELAIASKYPSVRIFQVALTESQTELTDLAGVAIPWSVPSAGLLNGGNFTHFSAVCWLFGRYLYDTLKYPVGLVESCWGGTPVEAWSSPRALKKCDLKNSMDSYFLPLSFMAWKSSVLWNAMIHPLLKMTIKGAIWYQGEANAQHNRDKYNCSFPAMIDDWRMAFNKGSGGQTAVDFPFGFVQLCTYKPCAPDGFPEIRWHQTADYGYVPNERMKNTFMAVALDLPDLRSPWGSIHPRYKQDVAHRLVLGARAVAYGEKALTFNGPYFKMIDKNEGFTRITYDQKITIKPSSDLFEICCSQGGKLCSEESLWLSAPLKYQGPDYVVLSIGECPISDVAALRYAWMDWPCQFKACTIYSLDGELPAPPFVVDLRALSRGQGLSSYNLIFHANTSQLWT